MFFLSRLIKYFFVWYIIVIFALFLYSFTQVDLNLTFSRASWFQTIEKAFQYIGYFNRPLSTVIFILLLLLLYSCYGIFLFLAMKKRITQKQIWILVGIVTAILTFSYTAFSYDIFNYIFDAKIFTWYHQNPYIHKALDFPQDKMIHFMRWTHRVYPYGPVWLAITAPLSFLGFNIFLPTFFFFKFLMAGSFLGTCFFLQKISKKLFPENARYTLVFFACNPLVLIECLVSAHNDIVMLFFVVVAIWFLIQKKWVFAFILLLLSIGIKFATVFLLPIFLWVWFCDRYKKIIKWEYVFVAGIVCMVFAVMAASIRTQFQPWYLLYLLPIASVVARKYYIVIPGFVMSCFALLEYVPYLYRGDWNPPVPTILFGLTIGGILVSVFVTIGYKYLIREQMQQ